MALKLYNKGSSSVSTDFNYNVPTNPRITNESAYSSTTRIFSILYPDDSTSESFEEVVSSAGLLTEYSNLTTTKGFRIRCYDSLSQTGIQLNTITLNSHYYFVLIHSDDENLHHFAKVTQTVNEDVDGDAFEFTPSLGKEIPKDTKFMIFKGPALTSPALAFTAGIKNELQDFLSMSRPIFYFDTSFDKENELNHNTKYFLRMNGASSGSSVTVNSLDTTFLTAQDFSNAIVDYSPFSLHVKLTDNLRELDNPKYYRNFTGNLNSGFNDIQLTSIDISELKIGSLLTGTGILNDTVITSLNPPQGITMSKPANATGSGVAIKVSPINEAIPLPHRDFTDYEDIFPNARRDSDDNLGALLFTGPTRYVHYDFSPVLCNKVEGVVDTVVKESVGTRAGLAESKLIDNYRILPNKITEGDAYRIRHDVFRGSLNDWVEMDIELDTYSAFAVTDASYTLKTSYSDIRDFLNLGDEVLINDRVYIANPFTATTLVLLAESRLQTESIFTDQSTVAGLSGNKIFRRAYNATDKTLLTDFDIIEGRTYNLHVKLNQDPFSFLHASVTASDKNKKLLTLSFDGDSYSTNIMEYAQGNYIVTLERFTGEVENIDSYKENSQTFMEIVGRDTFSKLLSPIINSNKLFSKDIIYSSDSFYNNLERIVGVTLNSNYTDFTITFSGAHGLSAGDKIFGEYASGSVAYVGTVGSVTSTTVVELEEYPRVEAISPTALDAYKVKEKNYVFNKALASNYRSIDTVTSLVGSADKGVIFEGGIKLAANGNDGSSTDKLVGSSSNNNPNALGYPIFEPSNMKSDKAFQSKLKETTAESFDVVNTLNDFTILDIQEEDNFTLVEVAPYVPLTLGRVEFNYLDTQDTTLTNDGTAPTTNDDSSFVSTGVSTRYEYLEPVYVDGVFIGYHIQTVVDSADVNTIYLDRKATFAAGNLQKISYKTSSLDEKNKFSYSLNLLNGAHLHGGKNIALLSPQKMNDLDATNYNNPLALMDFPISYTSSTSRETYINKFGLPMYRIYEIEKGNFNTFYEAFSYDTQGYDLIYYNNPSEIKYYANAYRFGSAYFLDGGIYKDSLVGVGKTGDVAQKENTSLVETRGFAPASGSRYFDTKHHPSGSSATTVYRPTNNPHGVDSAFSTKDILNQIDAKASRMFLFINSDLLPYSNARRDALMNPNKTRDITNYNLMLLKDTSSRSNSTAKQSRTGTKVITNVDSDYEICNIQDSDVEVNSLESFGIMRLTEVIYDWAFNQIDPENLPDKKRTLPNVTYYFSDFTTTTVNVNAVSDYSGAVITVDSDPTTHFTAGKKVVGSDGFEIGQVQSSSASPNRITLTSNANKTNDGAYYTGALTSVTPINTLIKGTGKYDTLAHRNHRINMLRGAIIGNRGTYNTSSGGFFEAHGDYRNSSSATHAGITDIIIPVELGDNLYTDYYPNNHPSQLMSIFNGDTAGGASQWDKDYNKNQFMVNFGNYSIENDVTMPNTDGMVVGLLTGNATRPNWKLYKSNSLHSVIYKSNYNVGTLDDVKLDTNNQPADDPAFGSIMGFKFRLLLDSSTEVSDKMVGDNVAFHYTIETSSANGNLWLDLINDLTGCYLVSEVGKYRDNTVNGTTSTSVSVASPIGSPPSLNDLSPNSVAYVLSHEIDIKDSTKTHIITVDRNLATDYYRIMQPNHTCFHDKTPKNVSLNKLSSSYTKKPYSDDMYGIISASTLFGKEAEQFFTDSTPTPNTGGSEAALSMYVLIDTDNRLTGSFSDDVVVRERDRPADLISINQPKTMCVSDGETSLKAEVNLQKTVLGYDLEFSDMKKMIGVVSISDIMTVKIPNNLDSEYSRAMIGAGVTIANDAEDIINELLEENDIVFDLTKADYPQYLAPNFQGVDLFSAINYLLNEKKKSLIKENETFIIKDESANDFYADVVLSDNGEYQIFNYEKTSTIFDQYNEVIVYGRFHRATRRNLKDINKRGKKTIEFFERELTTQNLVDKRATELLRLYSSDNVKIEIEVGHKGINQLRVGDIITMELRRENIPLNEYLVLQMEHLLTGNIKLTLGKYSKQLEDRFADLLIEGKKTNTAIRELDFNQNEVNFNFLQDIKVKPLRLLVRKRASTGTFHLGFVQPLGFVLELGFYGAVQITELLEEEY